MGICGSKSDKENARRNKRIGKMIDNRKDEQDMLYKLLLLGAGESGKSTLFKQMINIYGTGFSHEELVGYTNIVYNNIIAAMKTLLNESEALSHEFGPAFEISPDIDESLEFMRQCRLDADVDFKLAQHIKLLWDDAGIQETYDNRWRYQLSDGTNYFLDRIMEIGAPNFVPDEQDVLRCRVRTTGIVETEFEIDQTKFQLFDVGGQRNERKKWIHCFENVTGIIFVAALSEYDQVLYEDETTNRTMEALDLFDEICNSRWFPNTSMILFLNKRDLFLEKIRKVPLTVCFADYTGRQDYEEGCKFLQEKFESRNRVPSKEVYTQITCATDQSNITHVFNSAKDIVIRQSLREGGLMF
uniref:G protein, Alpha subunit family member n=1 Tax=Hirondellea gigas TaxID=1518452 RepID=A0A6A7GE84_9CRUS